MITVQAPQAPLIAHAFLAGDLEARAQRVEQRHPRLHRQRVPSSIHGQRDGDITRSDGGRSLRRRVLRRGRHGRSHRSHADGLEEIPPGNMVVHCHNRPSIHPGACDNQPACDGRIATETSARARRSFPQAAPPVFAASSAGVVHRRPHSGRGHPAVVADLSGAGPVHLVSRCGVHGHLRRLRHRPHRPRHTESLFVLRTSRHHAAHPVWRAGLHDDLDRAGRGARAIGVAAGTAHAARGPERARAGRPAPLRAHRAEAHAVLRAERRPDTRRPMDRRDGRGARRCGSDCSTRCRRSTTPASRSGATTSRGGAETSR